MVPSKPAASALARTDWTTASGGAAGHVNPALAVAQTFEKYHPGCQVLFVGAEKGMEKRLVEQAGYPIRCVKVSTFDEALHATETIASQRSADGLPTCSS